MKTSKVELEDIMASIHENGYIMLHPVEEEGDIGDFVHNLVRLGILRKTTYEEMPINNHLTYVWTDRFAVAKL
jgi:hypothetical protein